MFGIARFVNLQNKILVSGLKPERATDGAARLWIAGLLSCYALLRIALIPSHPDSIHGFSHDSAYIAIVANNLLAGKGLVNDAHWLVFLQPASLPMPFHNANPLYPLAVAGTARATGASVEYAALLISAFSSVGLVLAALSLYRWFCNDWRNDWRRALFYAFATALFPIVYLDSLCALPDALCLTLTFGFCAALVRSEQQGNALIAGILLGLAWLTRSTAALIVPAALLYSYLTLGWKQAARRWIGIAVAALCICAPWLWHTYRVWGSPFRSDASYYMLQDFLARAYAGDVTRFWHSTEPPLSLGQILRRQPLPFFLSIAKGIPAVIATLLGLRLSRLMTATIVVSLLIVALIGPRRVSRATERQRPLRVALLCLGVYTLLMISVFAVRASSVEIRYFAVLYAALGLGAGFSLLATAARLQRLDQFARSTTIAFTILSGCLWLLLIPLHLASVLEYYNSPDPQLMAYRALARQVDAAYIHGAAVVVGSQPYFYTAATKAPSLSIPQSDDAFLLRYMQRYHARYIFLTDSELAYWKPDWQPPGHPPTQIEPVARIGQSTLFKRK
jgi:4-amino-4-deoxy-L-arabinose transferase-like glycosyltransferase